MECGMHDWAVRTRRFEETVEAVEKVYCPHKIRTGHRDTDFGADLQVKRAKWQPLVRLHYRGDTTVEVASEDFSKYTLIMSCTAGKGEVVQREHASAWRMGQTLAEIGRAHV